MDQPALFEAEEEIPHQFGHTEIRRITARSILTKANGSLEGYDFSLNPYVGCGFACSYCYAAFFVPDEARAQRWGTWVDVKANAVHLLRRAPGLAGAKIFLGSVTDPYQPLEREMGITRSLLEVMVEVRPQPRIVVQTRSDLPVRDIDLLRRFEHLRVNLSVTTDDDEMRKRFEPACVSIPRRLEALRTLKDAGIATAACLCPLLPVKDPVAFAAKLREIRVDRVSIGRFHRTGRRFAAGTRDGALQLARELGWNDQAYERTVRALAAAMPDLYAQGQAFAPT